MKKVFTPFILFAIIASVVLSSCGSSNSVMKRRYTKGYYVSHSKNKHSQPVSHEKTSVVKSDQSLKVVPLAEKEISTTVVKTPDTAKLPVITANSEIVPRKVANKSTATQLSNPSLKINSQPTELSVKRSFKSINNALVQKRSAVAEDGLSLLWIVIVVLLVLFFLGLIGDVLGGLIYILLVIALVLLILWLLRIL